MAVVQLDHFGNGNGFDRADVDAGAATDALVQINAGHVVNDTDSTLRTAFLAFFASDAASGTLFAGESPAVVVGTHDNGFFTDFTDPNQLFRTRFFTSAAAGALFRIDTGHTVAHFNGIKPAGCNAVAVAKAAVSTRGRPAV